MLVLIRVVIHAAGALNVAGVRCWRASAIERIARATSAIILGEGKTGVGLL